MRYHDQGGVKTSILISYRERYLHSSIYHCLSLGGGAVPSLTNSSLSLTCFFVSGVVIVASVGPENGFGEPVSSLSSLHSVTTGAVGGVG